jgi:hypothetical protein
MSMIEVKGGGEEGKLGSVLTHNYDSMVQWLGLMA